MVRIVVNIWCRENSIFVIFGRAACNMKSRSTSRISILRWFMHSIRLYCYFHRKVLVTRRRTYFFFSRKELSIISKSNRTMENVEFTARCRLEKQNYTRSRAMRIQNLTFATCANDLKCFHCYRLVSRKNDEIIFHSSAGPMLTDENKSILCRRASMFFDHYRKSIVVFFSDFLR